jgi:hypothetical protein
MIELISLTGSTMSILQTSIYTVVALLYMALFGYPVVRLLLPRELRDELGHVFLLPVGYLVCCLVGFVISGSLAIGAEKSIWITTEVFILASALTLFLDIKAGINFNNFVRKTGELFILSVTVLVALLWPFLFHGADTYLGAVNPDYFAGLVDNRYLLQGNSVSEFTRGSDTFYPVEYISGSISSSGRFASGIFAMALEEIFQLPSRTALTLSIASFLVCVPFSIYIFTKVVLGFDNSTARLSSWLIGLSGSIGLSYIYFYLGQNSGLAAVPLIISVGYLAITEGSQRLTLLAAVLVNALLVVYFGMLPYALAPLVVLTLYVLYNRQISPVKIIAMISTFVAISLLINASVLNAQIALLKGWTNVIGQTLQGQYFLEFLTEAFFPYFFGLVVYPWNSSTLTTYLGDTVFNYALIISLFIAFLLIYSLAVWTRRAENKTGVVTFFGGLVIYAVVWWVYSFQQQYGYAVFKMASWLQFMLVPMAAYGITLALNSSLYNNFKQRIVQLLLVFASAIFVLANFTTTVEYGRKGLGDNPYLSYIVNNFEMSGNRDYFELNEEVSKIVGKEKSVGLIFVDSIQNFWVSYYLEGVRTSIMSHETMPGDDENLPDIITNEVVDYYGNRRDAINPFFHGAVDDYYLTWAANHINRDIAITRYTNDPLWENNTFRLFSKQASENLLFSGRGFYRMEYSQQNKAYWEPDRYRWSAVGGEFFFLNPSQKNGSYSLIFDIISGYEHDSDSRTIELWLGKEKFDEFVVQSASRYISKPFKTADEVNKLTVLVKERAGVAKRPMPLWNKDIPYDYRQLNVMLANVRVVEETNKHDQFHSECGSDLVGKNIHACAVSFNGIQLDRWIGKHAELSLANLSAANYSKVIISGTAPSFREINFPLKVKFNVQGKIYEREIAAAGKFTYDFPLVEEASRVVTLKIEPDQAKELRDEYRFRKKTVTQSLLLDRIMLQ